MKQIPAWFSNEILEGIQRLIMLSLPGTPAAETVAFTAQMWIESMWSTRDWDEKKDRWRFPRGFIYLAAEIDRWPSPKQLLLAMPSRNPELALPERPENSDLTPEQRQQNLLRLADLLAETLKPIPTEEKRESHE